MPPIVSLYDAKTKLSSLVERAAGGEEIVIAKNGVPRARLVPIVSQGQRRAPANAMRIDHIAADFDAPSPDIEHLFSGEFRVNLLLDTHVFLWWDQRNPALNDIVRAAIEDPGNGVFISAASVWEIAIKRRLGKLGFHGSAAAAIASNGFLELPIRPAEAEEAAGLSWRHTDPFDRMLVAQAMKQGLVLVTADAAIRAFDAVPQLWAR